MKRLVSIVILVVMFSSVALAEIPDLTIYSYEDLILIWNKAGELLRQSGYYPYVELLLQDSGDDVSALQKRLTELNYYSKPITGKFDSNTQTAMKAFEKANEFKQDGKASIEEQNLLFSAMAISKPTPTPKPTPRIASPTDIKSVAVTNRVTISWKTVNDAKKYNVYRSSTSDGNYQLLGSVTLPSYIDNNVNVGKTYYYKIESVNAGNVSKLTSAKRASVPTPSPTPDPRKAYKTFDFEKVARYPDENKDLKVKITGTVIQVLGDRKDGFEMRVATHGRYDNIVYIYTLGDHPANILEDDKITFYCTMAGDYTYESTMGQSITLPIAKCDFYEIK